MKNAKMKISTLIWLIVTIISTNSFLHAADLPKPEDQQIIKPKLVAPFLPWGKQTINIIKGEQLIIAVENNDIPLMQELILQGADVNYQFPGNELTPLMVAVMHRNEAITKMLVDKGADVEARDINGVTALILATYHTKPGQENNIIQLLLDHNADVNSYDYTGGSPLMLAAVRMNIWACQAFIDKGAQVNIHDQFGHTALMVTANEEIKQLLIDAGAR